MHTERVRVSGSCNQTCRHCMGCHVLGEGDTFERAAVLERIGEAAAHAVDEIVLAGGEPTLACSLPDYVEVAHRAGCRVAIETNATTIDAAMAGRLRAAGLDLARVKLGGFSDEVDSLTNDPGGFRRTVAGMRSLSAAGIRVEVLAVVVRSSLRSVRSIPERIVAVLGTAHGVDRIRISVPVDARDRNELVSYPEAAGSILALETSAALAHIPLELADGDPMPPCVFEHGERHLRLFSLEGGRERENGFVRIAPCTECAVSDRCPGLAERYVRSRMAHDVYPLRTAAEPRVTPPVDDTERFLVRTDRDPSTPHSPPRHVIAINFHCNQACVFCSMPTYLPPASDARIRDVITRAGRLGARIALSGGEPTLNPSLCDYVRLAHRATGGFVEIETNAMELEDPERVRSLVEAGLTGANVALHGSRPEIADAVTRSPGGFARTVGGADNLYEAGVEVTLRCVVSRANIDDLPELLRMVAGRWQRATVTVSAVEGRTELVPRNPETFVRHSELVAALTRARLEADRLGLRVRWPTLEANLPRCVLPSGPAPASRPAPTREEDGIERVKVAACRSCRLEAECPGVGRPYAEVYGIGELVPATSVPS